MYFYGRQWSFEVRGHCHSDSQNLPLGSWGIVCIERKLSSTGNNASDSVCRETITHLLNESNELRMTVQSVTPQNHDKIYMVGNCLNHSECKGRLRRGHALQRFSLNNDGRVGHVRGTKYNFSQSDRNQGSVWGLTHKEEPIRRETHLKFINTVFSRQRIEWLYDMKDYNCVE